MDEQAMQQFRADVVTRKNLPTLPTVLARILHLAESESASGRELIALIEHDQALTGKMLRLANSAFFGQSRRVSTIPRAVALLGLSTVRNLALGVKVWDTLGTGMAQSRPEELWAHALAVGVAAKTLAARLRAGDPDEAFTAGVLHDVGRLVLAMRFREEYWRVVGDAGEAGAIERKEAAGLGVDHAEVGGWILEAWSLPPTIVEAVRAHHAADARPGVPGLLAVADRLVAWTDLATGVMDSQATALLDRSREHGVTPAVWDDVLRQLREGDGLAALSQLEA